ncbi:MAG: neutral zinc metallopeptidase [Candidatus Paceibacterota bacterium]
MADWSKITSRGNVEDRRAMGPVGVGGLGIGGVLLVLLFNYLGGGSVTDAIPQVLNQLQNSQVVQQNIDTKQFEGQDNYEVFTSTVLGSTNDMWSTILNQNNLTYTAPKLILFRTSTDSVCGGATSSVGPHYCPIDSTIYLDETFFDELTKRFGAKGGDVAQAYVIAHEVGHHAQRELGILGDNGELVNGSNLDVQTQSIDIELQADCFAGLWAYSIKDKGIFLPGEISEALDAASAVGDDRIQENINGRINPETWTHGSSTDRVAWFTKGYNSGDLSMCDTFNK